MAATIPQHLQIINPSYPADGGGPAFSRFSQLPPELRLRIWNLSLEDHRRWLEIDIPGPPPVLYASAPTADAPEIPGYSTRNQLGNVISGRNYMASIGGLQLHSKLLRTSREAREVALRFYRVHIPLHFRATAFMDPPVARGTLYLSPECDIIELHSLGGCRNAAYQHPFLDFMHDLKAYDPQGIGICNLALGVGGIRSLRSLRKQNPAEAPAAAAFVDCVSRLQTITWMADSSRVRTTGVRFNRSVPIRGASPRFHVVGRDPRPVAPDLKYVATATSRDPRQMHTWWQEVLDRWEIRQVRPTKERVLLADRPDLPYAECDVWDAKTADEYLKEEENSWTEARLGHHVAVRTFAGGVPVEGSNELANATRPAIGFWLFPFEAFGDDGEGVVSWGPSTVFDLTGHWPELALSHLS